MTANVNDVLVVVVVVVCFFDVRLQNLHPPVIKTSFEITRMMHCK